MKKNHIMFEQLIEIAVLIRYLHNKKDPVVNLGFAVRNFLRIPKTNILIINTLYNEDQDSNIVYYNDLSSAAGEIINVQKPVLTMDNSKELQKFPDGTNPYQYSSKIYTLKNGQKIILTTNDMGVIYWTINIGAENLDYKYIGYIEQSKVQNQGDKFRSYTKHPTKDIFFFGGQYTEIIIVKLIDIQTNNFQTLDRIILYEDYKPSITNLFYSEILGDQGQLIPILWAGETDYIYNISLNESDDDSSLRIEKYNYQEVTTWYRWYIIQEASMIYISSEDYVTIFDYQKSEFTYNLYFYGDLYCRKYMRQIEGSQEQYILFSGNKLALYDKGNFGTESANQKNKFAENVRWTYGSFYKVRNQLDYYFVKAGADGENSKIYTFPIYPLEESGSTIDITSLYNLEWKNLNQNLDPFYLNNTFWVTFGFPQKQNTEDYLFMVIDCTSQDNHSYFLKSNKTTDSSIQTAFAVASLDNPKNLEIIGVDNLGTIYAWDLGQDGFPFKFYINFKDPSLCTQCSQEYYFEATEIYDSSGVYGVGSVDYPFTTSNNFLTAMIKINFNNFSLSDCFLGDNFSILTQESNLKVLAQNITLANNVCSNNDNNLSQDNDNEKISALFSSGNFKVTNMTVNNNTFCKKIIFSTVSSLNHINYIFSFQDIKVYDNSFQAKTDYLFFDALYSMRISAKLQRQKGPFYTQIHLDKYFKKYSFSKSKAQNQIGFQGGYIKNVFGVTDNYFVDATNSNLLFSQIPSITSEKFNSDSEVQKQYLKKYNGLQQQATLANLQKSYLTIESCKLSNLNIQSFNSVLPLLISSTSSNITISNTQIEDSLFTNSAINAQQSNIQFQNVSFNNVSQAAAKSRNLQLEIYSNPISSGASLIISQQSSIAIKQKSSFNTITCKSNCNGGAIQLLQGTISIDDTIFSKIESSFGGALYIEGINNTNTISNTQFLNCASQNDGGAFYLKALQQDKFDLTIQGSSLVNNICKSRGGAIFVDSEIMNSPKQVIQILNSKILQNQASIGGGIFQQNISINTQKDNVISSNTGTIQGNDNISYPSKLRINNIDEFLKINKGKQEQNKIIINDFRSGANLTDIQFLFLNDKNEIINPITQEDYDTYKISVAFDPKTANITQYSVGGSIQTNFNPKKQVFDFENITLIGKPGSSAYIQFSSKQIYVADSQQANFIQNYTFNILINFRLCGPGEQIAQLGQVTECQQCPANYYSFNVENCQDCPQGATCNGGTNVVANKGYWRGYIPKIKQSFQQLAKTLSEKISFFKKFVKEEEKNKKQIKPEIKQKLLFLSKKFASLDPQKKKKIYIEAYELRLVEEYKHIFEKSEIQQQEDKENPNQQKTEANFFESSKLIAYEKEDQNLRATHKKQDSDNNLIQQEKNQTNTSRNEDKPKSKFYIESFGETLKEDQINIEMQKDSKDD
ncbi:hypothetical protein ABPG74_000758 [Tetrahymena malaccensis]